MSDLIQSPLAEIHQDLGAKFAEFGGFSMPVEYSGVLSEHQAVRTGVGVFDVSHLGTFLVEGPGAAAYLNTRLSNDLTRIGPGQAQYTLLLNGEGGVVDDMIVYLLDDDRVMVIPNAANSAAVIALLQDSSPDQLVWTDRHVEDAIIAVQGPDSATVLAACGLPVDMGYMAFQVATLTLGEGSVSMTVCRTGYTGERGYEIVVAAQYAPAIWDLIMDAGRPCAIQPCGLGARDTLRTEMGYPLHGQDLSPEISPVEARVGWAVGWKKDHFDGDGAVREQRRDGAVRTLRGIEAVGRGIPRPGMSVVGVVGADGADGVDRGDGADGAGGAVGGVGGADGVDGGDGAVLGRVTSGTFSPTLKRGIGLALLSSDVAVGDRVHVEVRSRLEEFEVVAPPFVPSHVTD
ncbi:MAG: glycine cleavage system aminomethyltransferase GcvT [Propionibacteriaceae bacterium]|nr:glycine cleavage system aminomethyltransferase GcvT [Propionibacteriaceae bacterium]